MTDLAEKLLVHGIRLKAYEPGEHSCLCPQCSHTRRNAKAPCLGVKVDGLGGAAWICHHCQWSGNIPSGTGQAARPKKVYRRPAPPKVEPRPSPVIEWFRKRGISEETVEAFRCHQTRKYFPRLEEEAECLAFPYFWKGELINAKYRTKVKLEDGTEEKTFAQEPDAEPTLYNIDNLAEDEVIWVEGEPDVLACWEAGFKSVVSLANGAGKEAKFREDDKRLSPLKTHADQLAGLKKIIIATDTDGPGQALAEELAARFGKDRCWRVTFPEGCKDANDVLVKFSITDLVGCISKAAPWPIDGVYQAGVYTDDVWDLYHGRVNQPLSTHIPGMDEFWKIMPCSFNIVTGIPNHGKSNFLDQVTVNMGRHYGWNFAVFSPEHTPARHIVRLAEKLVGRPFYDGPNQRMSENDVTEALEWVDRHFLFLGSKDASPTIDWLIERFKWAALRAGIKAVVIDPYNEIEASRPAKQTETEFVSELISKLKRFGVAHDVAVFIVVHPAKIQKDKSGQEPVPTLYDLHGSAHWRNKADSGVVVHRDFETNETQIHVRKVREQPIAGQIGTVTLKFNGLTRRYEEVPVPFNSESDAA